MAGELQSATQLTAAGAIVLLAIWLLVLNFESRLHRALALLLTLRASVIVLNRAAALDPAHSAMWFAMREWAFLALLPAVGYFAATLAFPRHDARGRWARGGAAAVGLLAEALYLWDHCLASCQVGDVRRLGPLSMLIDGVPLGVAIFALGLAFGALRAPAHRRPGLAIAATGFLLSAALDAGVALAAYARLGPSVSALAFEPSLWSTLVFPLRMLAIVPVIGATLVLGRVARLDGRGLLLPATPVTLAAATGVFLGADPASIEKPLAVALAGVWLLALPLSLAYAILKHRLFEIDVRIRRGLRRGLVAGAFVFTFLLVSEVTQNWLDERYGVTAGGVATAFLLFSLKPLERASDRLSRLALPHAQHAETLDETSRIALYRDQALVAWEDGTITRKERALLDQLRARLAITAEVAARLESEAAHASNEAG